MSEQIIAAAVVVSAIAILVQLGLLLGIYRTAKSVEERVSRLAPKAESLIESAQHAVEESRKQVADISAKAVEVLSLTRTQVGRIDEILSDATVRAKVQLDRVELVLDDTMSRFQETMGALHGGILRPLREVNGLYVGLRTALGELMRRRRPDVSQVTADEEMFI
jgi:hypothetical protein